MEMSVAAALSNRIIEADGQSNSGAIRNKIEQSRATHVLIRVADQPRAIVRVDDSLFASQCPLIDLVAPAPPLKVSRERSLTDAARLMEEHDADAVLVFDGQNCIGVATRQSVLAALIEDIAGRRQIELRSRRLVEELARIGRISTMGEMASGLAHELNQPLAAIVAYVDACQELIESGRMNTGQLIEILRSVSGQAERAGQIIHHLRKMIKRSQPVRASMNINQAIREVAALFEAEAREANVELLLEFADNLPEAAADLLQIQQVVLQLLRNGLEAMTDVAAEHRRLALSTGRTPSGEIEVAIRDLGSGLPEDVAVRIFEPFFSTKSNGLGLGLPISRTIVDAHGGRIWLTPESPKGVTARFTLPAGVGRVRHGPQADRVHR